MHLQKLRSSSALHLPSTRQRNDGFHENQSETQISSLIFPTQSFKSTRTHGVVGKLFKTAAIAATFAAFTVPQVLSPQTAHAKPTDKPVGTWGRTTGSATYIRIRPGTQTPVVAKVSKGTQLMVWGTFDGWYRVETTDHKFGWIYHDLVSVPNADKLKTLSHAKAKQASDRSGYQTLYGTPESLKKYYAAHKAPGAKVGLAKMGISLQGKKPAAKFVSKPQHKPVVARTVSASTRRAPVRTVPTRHVPALPREVTITTAEPRTVEAKVVEVKTPEVKTFEAKPVEARMVEVKAPEVKPIEAKVVTPVVRTVTTRRRTRTTELASRRSTGRSAATTRRAPAVPVQATTVEPMSPSKLPQITAADIMNARRAYIQNQLSSRHKTRPSTYRSSADSTIKTAPAAKPVKSKVQPTAAKKAPLADLDPTELAAAFEAEVIGSAYYQANAQKTPSRGGSPRDYVNHAKKKGTFGGALANQALSYRGMPYIMGASSPKRGFDCSGLIYYLLRSRGYNPPRTAAGFASYGKSVPRSDLKAGDLVLFANTYKRGISHIGIYIGNNKFVHAANRSAGVKTDSLSSSYYAKKYHSARRVPVK